MSVSEKVAYLRGLMEGLELDENSKEAKLFDSIVDTLDDIASELSDFDEDLGDLGDYVEELDEDLADLEEYVYDDDCDCCDDDDCDCCCDDDETYEVECPSCGEKIYLDESMFDEDYIECPACGEKLELDIDYDDCDGDCDCCGDDDE